jgi:hypothetical protein
MTDTRGRVGGVKPSPHKPDFERPRHMGMSDRVIGIELQRCLEIVSEMKDGEGRDGERGRIVNAVSQRPAR